MENQNFASAASLPAAGAESIPEESLCTMLYPANVLKIFKELDACGFELQFLEKLESSGILESCLWPHFPDGLDSLSLSSTASCFNQDANISPPSSIKSSISINDAVTSEHFNELEMIKAVVLVLTSLINEKFRQRIDISSVLNLDVSNSDNLENSQQQSDELQALEKFRLFFYTVWLVFLQPTKFLLTSKHLSVLVQWFINIFQSLEYSAIRRVTMSICGISSWNVLSVDQKQELLKQRPGLNSVWKFVAKRYRRLNQQYGDKTTFTNSNITLQDRFLFLDKDGINAALEQFIQFIEDHLGKKIDSTALYPTSNVITVSENWTAVDVFSGTTSLSLTQNNNTSVQTSNAMPDDNVEEEMFNLRSEQTVDISSDDLLYCERFLEFLIDLLSQLPTRRFFRPIFLARQILPRLRLSLLYRHKEAALIRQLATLLSGYEAFEVDDATGDALETKDLEAQHYNNVKELQIACFRYFQDVPFLQEIALGPVSNLESSEVLRCVFQRLTLSQLLQLAKLLRLVEVMSFADTALKPLLDAIKQQEMLSLKEGNIENVSQAAKQKNSSNSTSRSSQDLLAQFEMFKLHDAYIKSHRLLIEVLANHLRRRPNQLDAINELPLFPTELLIWDPSLIPTEHYRGDFSLALPKLNMQFLTVRDYLFRNFHLFRLESAYEIREDLEDAIWRMKPTLGYDIAPKTFMGQTIPAKLDTEFLGSARMAIPIDYFSIVYVKEPNVGEAVPAEVRAEITVNLKRVNKEVRQEWDTIRQYDVLFLLAIQAPSNRFEGRPCDLKSVAQFPEKFGVLAVRGCEVVEVLDEEGNTVSELLGGETSRQDAFGDLRTYRVILDPQQYKKDLDDMISQSSDLQSASVIDTYGALNLLVRRKPAESNFKAILSTVRNLMNDRDYMIVPSWLHDLFLGYGDPSEALYFNLSTELKCIDFVDTFLDEDHVKECFSQSVDQISFTYETLGETKTEKNSVIRNDNQLPLQCGDEDADEKLFKKDFLCRLTFKGMTDFKESKCTTIQKVEKKEGSHSSQDTQQINSLAYHPSEASVNVALYRDNIRGPYQQCLPQRNCIRFTRCQVEAIRSGVNPGLTIVVGPPGTGKTDTAVQIALLLHKNFPEQRILVLAHSNQALNDLFEKIAALDIDERYLLRLGMGEKELKVASDRTATADHEKKDFSKWGRVNHMLQRRIDLLKKVDLLGISLQAPGDVGASCEVAIQFYRRHIIQRIKRFRKQIATIGKKGYGLRLTLRDMREEDGITGLHIGPNGLPIRKVQNIPMETTTTKKHVLPQTRKSLNKSHQKDMNASIEEEEEEEEDEEEKEEEEEQRKENENDSLRNASVSDDEADSYFEEGIEESMQRVTTRDELEKSYLTIEDLDDQACIDVQQEKRSVAEVLFPFKEFFSDAPTPLFASDNLEEHENIAEGCFCYLVDLFKAIEECRAFELLRTLHDRATYLLTRHAKIIAMTCTHAALVRQQMIDMRLCYDTLIMEEAAQVLEVETFIPMLLQRPEHGGTSRLKRVILLGDHHQLPPVVKNRGFQQHGRLDQSMFSRFIRLRVPYIQLDSQGRSRSSIRELFGWHYTQPPLKDLPIVLHDSEFLYANGGFRYDYQFIDVQNYNGCGEHCPLPHFYQNLGEAEYAVAIFMYMRLLGYPSSKIAILTTYNGQKALLKEVLQRRCGWNPAIGWPAVVSTVDKFQGQQADYVILSLVRTTSVGHLRDVRRLIVAVSRARLGLYIVGRFNLFYQCLELKSVFNYLERRPRQLAVTTSFESSYRTSRRADENVTNDQIRYVGDIYDMWEVVQDTAHQALAASQPPPITQDS